MDQILVSVKQGHLRGKECKDYYGRKYYSFQGIPYARPPVNELRFKAPLPLDKWEGVLDATKEGNRCYARHNFFQKLMGSEDCLFLNIYTPSLHSPLLPVMFWIHGGGYVSDSGSSELYAPDFLVPEDVVLVTINYRLGMLGFLSLKDPSLGIPGNAGLKDQVLALKWVKSNIEQFGGDPNNITIFGQSVGGGSVHYLMLSPLSKGIFHKAIIQSGSALSNRGRGQYSTPLISKALKLNSMTDVELLHVLKELAVEELFELQEKIPEPYLVSVHRPFGFVVEPYLTEGTFLAEEPIDIIKSVTNGQHVLEARIQHRSIPSRYRKVSDLFLSSVD
uniref:Carboxylesterase type B domain-containing protein n=1 Tax=Photinus pyralis TaxID=7054 RepID=A0A1Y1LQM7_PHOPY